MIDKKIPAYEKLVIMLPDKPNAAGGLTAEDLKEWFDAAPEEIRVAFNSLIDELASSVGGTQIGFSASGFLSTNVSAAIVELLVIAQAAQAGELLPGIVTDPILSDAPTDLKQRFANFKSGYEYQTPTVVGLQVRVAKPSDSSIVKFRLTSEISGGNITISTDGGITSVELKDGEGTNVVELSAGLVEVVYVAPFFILRSSGISGDLSDVFAVDDLVYRAELEQFGLIGETVSYGGTIYSIAVDDVFIYAGGDTTNTVRVYNKSTRAYVGETASYGSTILSIVIDNNFIYVGGAVTNKVRVYNKSTRAYVGETASYGGNIRVVIMDGSFIYVGGDTPSTVRVHSILHQIVNYREVT